MSFSCPLGGFLTEVLRDDDGSDLEPKAAAHPENGGDEEMLVMELCLILNVGAVVHATK